MASSGFFGLIRGETVTVGLYEPGEPDQFGEYRPTWADESVDNVLFQVGTTDDLAATRPNGTRIDATFHFTKRYVADLEGRGKSLYRAHIKYRGKTYEVEGDPQPTMAANTPGPWCLSVPAKNVQG